VIVVDANVFLYAYNEDAPQQRAAAEWLTKLLESGEMIGLPWVTLWAFIRISTNSRIWTNPRSVADAFAIVGEWLTQPGVVPLQAGPLHFEILEKLSKDHGVAGALTTDAVLAAIAIEHGGSLASTDQGFRRFTGLKWLNPLGV
jgi:toxin-antitoxin system PIN domain toxin